ncbi:MAG: hypothetical protein ABSD10_01580 [Candidatus Saccharimonadales bacterium]|jgi:hypothetical protein
MPERYEYMTESAAFGLLENALFDGGEDVGATFPRSDAEDMSRGARFIPSEVTIARRAGQQVQFVTSCGACCWYWEMPDGSRIYHYDPLTYDEIGRHNHGPGWTRESGPAGPCHACGNKHTSGGTIAAEETQQ